MSPKEIKELFQQYLNEIERRPSEKTIRTYFRNLDGQVSTWAKQLGIVKETIYEKYLPEDVESLRESLLQNVDLKKNNNSYHAPLTWYKDFCDSSNFETIVVENQPTLNNEQEYRIEGGQKVVISMIAERDSTLRKKAIEIHGVICAACDFDFKKKYGQTGEGFIEIHHIKQLRSEEKFVLVNTNPKTDLIPLCSNCHRIVHIKKNTVLSISELKDMLKKAADNK